MSILPSGSNASESSIPPQLMLDSRQKHAARFLLAKDPTGGLLSTVLFMDSVEDWVVNRLEFDDDQVEAVRARQQRLSEILTQYRQHVPPDNHAFLQLLSWMKSSESFYTLDYMGQFQTDFMVQFVEFCRNTRHDDVNASLTLQRINVLFRTRLADRIYSPENFEFVMSVFMDGALT